MKYAIKVHIAPKVMCDHNMGKYDVLFIAVQ